jgi:hypothetical protein
MASTGLPVCVSDFAKPAQQFEAVFFSKGPFVFRRRETGATIRSGVFSKAPSVFRRREAGATIRSGVSLKWFGVFRRREAGATIRSGVC